MALRRKLFLTHAGELAHLLLRDVGRDGLVARFARSYAERHGRKGLLSDPARLPELETTIGREALLVMAAELRQHLSQEYRVTRSGALRPEEAAFIDIFFAEFLAALIRGLKWSAQEISGDADMFRRDLEMYRRWGDRPAPVSGVVRADESESPFPDRCALLLDPAMMEQARRAATEFEKQITQTAARRFRQLGRSAVVTRTAKRSMQKSPVRRKKSRRRTKKPVHSARKSPRPNSKQRLRRRTKSKIAKASKKKPSGPTRNSPRPKPKSPSRNRFARR